MALPCYVSTEWLGLGHATLRFRPRKVEIVKKLSKPQNGQAGEDEAAANPGSTLGSWWPGSWSYNVPWFSSPKNQVPVETQQIECFLSTVYIGEYGERKNKEAKENKETSQHEEGVEEAPGLTNSLEAATDDLQPPGIETATWNAWLEYWAAWQEVLIPLSWVHKYREHCTAEYISRHDSYLNDYPEVLSLITEDLGVGELRKDAGQTEACEDTGSDSEFDMTEFYEFLNGDGTDYLTEHKAVYREAEVKDEPVCTSDATRGEGEDREVLDDLYSKHTKKRYLVHLRSFLHSSGVECTQDLDEFFNTEAGIDFHIQTSTEGNTEMNTTGLSEDDAQNSNTSPSCDVENEHKSQEQMEESGEGTLVNGVETSIHEELHLSNSSVPQKQDEGMKESHEGSACEERREQQATEPTDSSGNEEKSVQEERTETHNTSTSSSQEHKTSKRRQKKKDTVRAQGMSWALKYVQNQTVDQSEDVKTCPVSLESTEEATGIPELLPESLGQTTNRTSKPDTSTSQIDTETSKPDTSTSQIDTETSEADTKTLEADTSTSQIDTKTTKPDTTISQTDTRTSETDTRTSETDTRTSTPDIEASETDTRTSETDSESSERAEQAAIDEFFSMSDETDRKFWKNYEKNKVRRAMEKALKEPKTNLAKFLAACRATLDEIVKTLKNVLLPFTGLHFLNVALPGAAVVEYESSVTEEVPGERERLRQNLDEALYFQRINMEHYLPRVTKFCLTTLQDVVWPLFVSHLTNLAILASSEIESRFPATVFGVRWLPPPEPSFSGDNKSIQRQQRRLQRWLEEQNPNVSPTCTVQLRGMIMYRVNQDPDLRKPQRVYQQVVKEEGKTQDSSLTPHTIHPLGKSGECGGSDERGEVEWPAVEISFDKDGNFYTGKENTAEQTENLEDAEVEAWNEIISGCQRLSYRQKKNTLPSDLPKDIQKYWAQRYRLFLKYDEGIRLDNESWYSVTPEFLAAHQARRCCCEVAVDAMCGAGGNAIQLAKTCGRVIAIDKDPRKVELARHNAKVYGVDDRIEFRVGNFFKMASYLKGDVVYLSPPWGGMEYLQEEEYNVYRLGGTMNCACLLRAARTITPNVALYLPRNSDVCQVIALAGAGGTVDIETNYMGAKKKAITAYFGDLAHKGL